MIPAGQRRLHTGKARLAAALYLQSVREGDSLTMQDCADRFGVGKTSVWNALVGLRKQPESRLPDTGRTSVVNNAQFEDWAVPRVDA